VRVRRDGAVAELDAWFAEVPVDAIVPNPRQPRQVFDDEALDELKISIEDQLNPHGGAIALGHPFGQTGARIMTTLLNDLETLDKTIGLETMCVGGGQGMAMLVERLN
jgi:acetyl-CoA acetyltransferase